ncbi:tRNA pseudouridine(38-40) synthase TruA [Thalassobacillus hwangdonensis]|uniref:tRNA pseudouridine synthase A n=1 Tax=Thalassobacillus hwangdonensis TaxID=546108 RepID=A0ABW3L851_9BACI
MQRMKCIIQYDGTAFAGYQVQPDQRTVQSKLEAALTQMHKGKEVKVVASGRTDAGVHAKGQVVHFDTSLDIPLEGWKKGLKSLLPPDIGVLEVQSASESFHARYDTVGKEYRYVILNQPDPDIFKRNYAFHVREELNVEAMREACRYLEGEHDFTSFCSARTEVKGDKVRTIMKADVQRLGSELTFTFRGSGFLYNMVRILVGTLVEIGKGERDPVDIPSIIDARNRAAAGKTAPPQGLFLWEVHYPQPEM